MAIESEREAGAPMARWNGPSRRAGRAWTSPTYGLDKYGWTIADVLLSDGTNVNHELVKVGWCW